MNEQATEQSQKNNMRFILFAVIHLAAIFAYPLAGYLFPDIEPIIASLALLTVYYCLIVVYPSIRYIERTMKTPPATYFKMSGNTLSGLGWGALIGLAVCIIFFIVNGFKVNETAHIRGNLGFLFGYVLLGIIEEIPFRGFYLQQFTDRIGFFKANVLTSVIFSLLHLARLIGASGALSLQLIILFVISLWLGYIFNKTKSFWAAALVHIAYNLAIYFF